MKRNLLLLCVIILLTINSINTMATQIPEHTARKAAVSFLNSISDAKPLLTNELQLLYGSDGFYYVFGTQNTFVIIAADDIAKPVLGYGEHFKIPSDTTYGANFFGLLKSFERQILFAHEQGISQNAEISKLWKDLENGSHQKDNSKSGDTSPQTPSTNSIKTKYQKTGLTDEKANLLIDTINTYMLKEKPYLNQKLSIQNLSQAIQIPTHHISQVLNDVAGQSFFAYTNSYRTEAFIEKIKNDEHQKNTLLGLAYDCGFNSKTSFNRIFKEIKGVSPSEFIKSRNG